jgi:hypothetical protein
LSEQDSGRKKTGKSIGKAPKKKNLAQRISCERNNFNLKIASIVLDSDALYIRQTRQLQNLGLIKLTSDHARPQV